MTTLIIIALTVLVTTCSIAFGYSLANYNRQIDDDRWFDEMTFEDFLSDTPIAHKMNREYGYEN